MTFPGDILDVILRSFLRTTGPLRASLSLTALVLLIVM